MPPRIDPFVVMLTAAAALGIALPAHGQGMDIAHVTTNVVIAGLFGLYGARLSPGETRAGLAAWRVHLTILTITFGWFPLVGIAAQHLAAPLLPKALLSGVLLLTLVPSTVQSAVAFTGIAGGDSALAVISASLSSLLGVWLTPLLVAVTMGGAATVNASSVLRIIGLLLVPFLVGQLLCPWIGGFVERHDKQLKLYDRGSIVFVVYTAFSAGTNAHVWGAVGWAHAVVVVVLCLMVLAIAFAATWVAGRPFRRSQRIAITFCGTNKSIAAGLPMASVLFSASSLALIVLPLMIYHLSQLVVCSSVANRQRTRYEDDVRTSLP